MLFLVALVYFHLIMEIFAIKMKDFARYFFECVASYCLYSELYSYFVCYGILFGISLK